jgi:hypothetical protein
MKHTSLLLLAACSAVTLSTLALAGLLEEIRLVHTPKQGEEVTKTYTREQTMKLVDSSATVIIDGEEQDEEDTTPDLEMVEHTSVVVVETVRALEDERVRMLTRKYEQCSFERSMEMTMPDGETRNRENEETSDLEGKTVAFRWDSDEEAYSASWAADEEQDGEDELLEGLQADSSLAWLLPAEAIDVDGEWELDTAAFGRLMSPMGLFHWQGGSMMAQALPAQLRDALEVEDFTLKLVSVKDGLALVGFEAEAGATFELLPPEGVEMPPDLEISMNFDYQFELKGELTWDLEANRALSLTLGGSVAMETTEVRTDTRGDSEIEATREQASEGTFSHKLSIE